MSKDNLNKRSRTNSIIDNIDQLGASKIFNFSNYLKLINKTNLFDNFNNFKSISKKNHFSENDVIRLNDESYIQESEFQNIKILPDCFDEEGNLVDIYPSCRYYDEIKINNIPKDYNEYVQILLNILNLDKCVVYVYNYIKCNNTRDIRKIGIKLNEDNYGVIINSKDNDVYWVLEHIQKIVIHKQLNFNLRKIKNINNQFMSLNIDKYVTPKVKKRKINYLDEHWIAASKTRNAALNDHCLDYFRAYNILDINDIPEKQEFSFEPSSKYERINKSVKNTVSFIDFLLTQGNVFEDKIIKNIEDKYSEFFVKICNSYEARNISNYKKTVNEMKKGTPIIYQPVLYCYKYKVFGCADLIVRSDWLNKITNNKILNENEESISSFILDQNYHYRVIDVKYSKLHFNTDELTLRNTPNVKPFKTQISLYNLALGEMQGYTPDQSYIIGNGWVMNKIQNKKNITKLSENPFDKFGVIDYKLKDNKYIQLSLEAINWLKDLNSNKHFTHDPPNDYRIYPNMCNSYDGIYSKVKKQIAYKYNEITLIPQCGVKNRNIAHKKNITSYLDKNCNSKNLNILGEKTKKFIDTILDFNKQKKNLINVTHIKSNQNQWRNTNKISLYIDFETINSLLLNSSSETNLNFSEDFVFMIGLGWQLPNNNDWNYKCFYCEKINFNEEYRILNDFTNKIKLLQKSYEISNVYHWSPAETTIYNKLDKRYPNVLIKLDWFDLMKFFKDNEIYILGALNFSLKTIATKMYEYKMINTVWNDDCTSGLDAMFKAWKYFISNNTDKDVFKEIIKYNEIDCKTMFEILNYLRLKK